MTFQHNQATLLTNSLLHTFINWWQRAWHRAGAAGDKDMHNPWEALSKSLHLWWASVFSSVKWEGHHSPHTDVQMIHQAHRTEGTCQALAQEPRKSGLWVTVAISAFTITCTRGTRRGGGKWPMSPIKHRTSKLQEDPTFISQSLAKGHLCCFQVWVIMKKAAVNIFILVFSGSPCTSLLSKY